MTIKSKGAVRPGALQEPLTYDSKVIAHTMSDLGNEIITYELTMPYWIIQDFNTHRAEIERNSASTRAVPTSIMLDVVRTYPVMPFEWRYNSKGMVPPEVMSDEDAAKANKIWLKARNSMMRYARELQREVNADKQRANMLLIQWLWTKVVCTMTDGGGIGMNNFFGLRDAPNSRPELRHVVHMMHEQYHNGNPEMKEWHLPYVDLNKIPVQLGWDQIALISSARCGRVTHYRQGQTYDLAEEVKRGEGFFRDGHFSPLRHAARQGGNEWYGHMYGWEPISRIIAPNSQDYMTKCCERAKK